ncbi:unnamed protein product [Phytomonas sp. EM1]|nr:unnamed protein product [Phytomonas sp. EM1]|eukprot:CCW64853.1 unnamed protein product [Phytomonas sp. isolate EM1]
MNEVCDTKGHFPDSDACDTRCYGVSSHDVPPLPSGAKPSKKARKAAKSTPPPPEADPLEDHLAGSLYQPRDLCADCGFPRGSSVRCPATSRHHGTNAPLPDPTGGKVKRRSFLGRVVKKLFSRHAKPEEAENSPFTSLAPGPRSSVSGCGPSESAEGSGSDNAGGAEAGEAKSP